jgi:hypothetical protein
VGLSIGFSRRSIFSASEMAGTPGASGRGFDLTDKNATWAEMTSVCGESLAAFLAISNKMLNGKWNSWTSPKSLHSESALSRRR